MVANGSAEKQCFEIETNPFFLRLQESLHPSEDVSDIEVEVNFTKNVLGLMQLDLSMHGSLLVQCQRCLSAYALQVQQMTKYLLFENEKTLIANSEQLSDKFETLLLPAPESSDKARQGEIDLIALVEDELLLSIPLYPRHEEIEDF